MYGRGLVIGKFWPPHAGHSRLIQAALEQCTQVTVLVCDSPKYDIPAWRRVAWLREMHPEATVEVIPVGDLPDIDHVRWARHTVATLGYVPDAVFTSEDYGDPYAQEMGCAHVPVDPAREQQPISGTLVRSEPMRYAQFLAPCVRAYYVPRVVVLGAESTGTTTLARALAAHYGEPWVPEYGRIYCEGRGLAAPWSTQEFTHIARMQNDLEEQLARRARRFLVCDTDALATAVWHERYVGTRSAEVEALVRERPPLLYIVTAPDIPFVQDGLRDGEHLRAAMHERFVEVLREWDLPFIVASGTHEARMRAPMEWLEPQIR